MENTNITATATGEAVRPDVMRAIMRLMRSMRRRPPRPEDGLFPGGGRLLGILAGNEGVSSRELAELLDIRPSSLSELLARLEGDGLIARTPDESDKRVSRVSLTDKGRELGKKTAEGHEARRARMCACFTDEEAAAFCEMCERLGAHMEQIAREDGEDDEEPDGFMPPPPPGFCPGQMPGGFPGGPFGGGMHRHHPPRPRKLEK